MSCRCTLLFCADCTTAWNIRKKIISSAIEEKNEKLVIFEELQISKCVLLRKPKSGETFAHRRWLLKKKNLLNFNELVSFFFTNLKYYCTVLPHLSGPCLSGRFQSRSIYILNSAEINFY